MKSFLRVSIASSKLGRPSSLHPFLINTDCRFSFGYLMATHAA
jgi:hypothetical protein